MISMKNHHIIITVFLVLILAGMTGCKAETKETEEERTLIDTSRWDPDQVIESNDLTIGWIERLPKMNYVWKSKNPTRDGWPQPGQNVTWRVHIKNWSGQSKTGISYQWKLDNNIVSSGQLDIPAGTYTSTDFNWQWTFNRHQLSFVLEPDQSSQNHLTIQTDALSLGLYVEQSVYNYFHENQPKLNIGSISFEGWAQRQIRIWNDILRTAVFPETPDGVLDRVRIDNITIVADKSLPLVPVANPDFDAQQAVPNLHDRSVDMQWGFPDDYIYVYSDHTTLEWNNQFFYSGFLQHELGHARYLIDVYGFNVYHGRDDERIDITEDGEPVPGSIYMPGTTVNDYLRVHTTQYQGMMTDNWTVMDRYSAVCMNLIAGHRAVSGNYNAPENIGIFLNDLPEENRLTIKDEDGNRLAGAHVLLYQSSFKSEFTNKTGYPKYFDNRPDHEFTADSRGRILLGRCPFSDTGTVSHDWNNHSNTAFILRVEYQGKVGYAIMDISGFNMAYWRGDTELADHTITVTML